jgi:TPR repeat protein
MYANGRGVPENYVDAYKWFVLALAQGNGLAEYDRDLLRGIMTPAQIAEAQKLAAEWKPKN